MRQTARTLDVGISRALPMALFLLLAVGCGHDGSRELNIPAGLAAETLKEFSRQAEIQIIFDPRSVAGVTTNAVEGRLSPDEALERMVRGTPLFVRHDDDTGAYAIIRRAPARSSSRRSIRMYLVVTRRPADLPMNIKDKPFYRIL